ncbi:response regulator [Micromonospora sp. CA-248089]|uniref:response regulator n=1 Tax=Micromonospora sp. CA-248089 TaxID=3239960 RepID=UPI003D949088
MSHVLIVDDERVYTGALRILLRSRGYEVSVADRGEAALRAVYTLDLDVVLLDLGLPDMDGVDVIREIRKGADPPIIVLSGRTDSRDKVQALDAGADDYMTKPFTPEELFARIRAVIRRLCRPEGAPQIFFIGRSAVDMSSRIVTDESGEIRLTRTEWRLLEQFLRQPGKVLGHRRLLSAVWGPSYQGEAHYLRQYVARLRRKLEVDPARPRHFLTESGMGYRFHV